MYILYNKVKYPCKCRPAASMVYHDLPDDFPAPVEGEIVLCADDGFTLRTDSAADYLRQTFEGGVLTLTNVPEPETEEETETTDPSPTLRERVTELETDNTLLKAQIAAQSEQMDFYEDCIAEMAMVVYA